MTPSQAAAAKSAINASICAYQIHPKGWVPDPPTPPVTRTIPGPGGAYFYNVVPTYQDQVGFVGTAASGYAPLFASTGKDEINPNIFYRAENIGLWSKMKSYDGKKGTNFASHFSVEDPDKAPPMRSIEANYLQHQTRSTPIDAVTSLLKALKEIKVDALVSQRDHLEPMLDEVGKLVDRYKKMMEAAQD